MGAHYPIQYRPDRDTTMTGTPDMGISKKQLLLLLLTVIAAISVRMIFLHEPFERDEGLYAHIGQEILRGGLPYRDAMDQKPPGIHYIYATLITIFGATTEGIRIGTALYSAGTLLAIFLCSRRVFGTGAGLWAAMLYGIFSSGPLIRGSSSNSEVFMVLPVVLSVYLLLLWADRPKTVIVALSGLLLGSAMVIKTVALPHVLAGFLFVLITAYRTHGWRKTLSDTVAFSCCSIIPLAGSALFFYFKGAFQDYYYWTIEFNKMYGTTSPAEFFHRMGLGLSRTAPELLPMAAPALITIFRIFTAERSGRTFLLAATLAAAFVGLSMPTKFFEHYFIQLVPPLAILAGAGVAYVTSQRKSIAILAVLPFVAATAYWATTDYKFYLSYSPDQVSAKKYASEVFVNNAKIARYVKERTTPADYIFQWGFEPEIYFLADRRSPNLYTVHFAVDASRDPWQATMDLGRSILTKRPVYIIVQQGRTNFTGFSELQDILNSMYFHERDLYGSQLWRLR